MGCGMAVEDTYTVLLVKGVPKVSYSFIERERSIAAQIVGN